MKNADYAMWAEMAGLDRVKFETCRASNEPRKRVEHDIREGGVGLERAVIEGTNGLVI